MEKLIIQTKLIKAIKNVTPKKDSQEVFKTIYYNKGYIYTTNGKMALKFSTQEMACNLENGKCYNIISISKENKVFSSVIIEKSDLQFPDIERIFNDFTYKEDDHIRINLEDDIRISESLIILWEKTKNAYRYIYLEELQVIDYLWRAYNIGNDKFIYLKSTENYEAIIMPFKVKF